jgi:Ankyrin repeat
MGIVKILINYFHGQISNRFLCDAINHNNLYLVELLLRHEWRWSLDEPLSRALNMQNPLILGVLLNNAHKREYTVFADNIRENPSLIKTLLLAHHVIGNEFLEQAPGGKGSIFEGYPLIRLVVLDGSKNQYRWRTLLATTENIIHLINVQDDSGATALMYAAALGDVEMVHILLEVGAKPELTNKHGQMVLDLTNGLMKGLSKDSALYAAYKKIRSLCNKRMSDRYMRLIEKRYNEGVSFPRILPREIARYILSFVSGAPVDQMKLHPHDLPAIKEIVPLHPRLNRGVVPLLEEVPALPDDVAHQMAAREGLTELVVPATNRWLLFFMTLRIAKYFYPQ